MMGSLRLRGGDAALSLAIAFCVLLTVLTLYFLGRHHFLAQRPAPHVISLDKLPQTNTGVTWVLDSVTSGSRHVLISSGDLSFWSPASAPLQLRGWAVDSAAHAPVLDVIIRTDFGKPFHALYGIRRPDVAAAQCMACTNSGVQVNFDSNAIPPGIHKLWLNAIRADATALYVPPAPLISKITGPTTNHLPTLSHTHQR